MEKPGKVGYLQSLFGLAGEVDVGGDLRPLETELHRELHAAFVDCEVVNEAALHFGSYFEVGSDESAAVFEDRLFEHRLPLRLRFGFLLAPVFLLRFLRLLLNPRQLKALKSIVLSVVFGFVDCAEVS